MSGNVPRTAFLAACYQRYLDHQDTSAFVQQVSVRYTSGTLERLAEHPDRVVRRGAVLALGYLADYESNPVMGRALVDEDRTVRLLAESGIRNVWTRLGTAAQRQAVVILIRYNTAQHYQEAIRRATLLIDEAPWLPEPWNQRAVAWFALGKYAESIQDCLQALELNPYHFAAAAGMGQAQLQLHQPSEALECFRRALRLNPGLEGARVQVARLTRLVEGP